MKSTFSILAVLLLATLTTHAQKVKCQNDGPDRKPCEQSSVPTPPSSSEGMSMSMMSMSATSAPASAATVAPGPVTSPAKPNYSTDSRFVVNEGTYLDTGCTYRSGGPLRIPLPIKRFVGETDGQGFLTNPAGLVQNGIVANKLKLRMPAYDVDMQGDPPEVDKVFFNGHEIGVLTGANGVWKINEFTIPVEWVRFGKKGESGAPSIESVNEIEIQIDTASGGEERWCTYIDWIELSVEAMYPVIMVHGNSQSGEFWEKRGFVQPFRQQMIPFDNSISFDPKAAPIEANSAQLATELPKRAKQFGVKHIHIVAHSKGGLDVRDFLARRLPELSDEDRIAVLSVSTLSTPHHGSVGADYILDAETAGTILGIPNSDNPYRARLAELLPSNDGYPNLRVDYVERIFNPENQPNLPLTNWVEGEDNRVSYFSFAADANLNRSRDAGGPTIQPNETEGFDFLGINISSIPQGLGAIQEVYRILGTVEYTYTQEREVEVPVLGGTTTVTIVSEKKYADPPNARPGFRLNDIFVTVDSARLPKFVAQPYVGANHATISDPFVAQRVIAAIRSVRR